MFLLILFLIFLLIWYYQKWTHPQAFPPGPRKPLPIVGDAHLLDKEVYKSFCDLTLEYGDICGFWLGSKRTVIVSNFEMIQDILSLNASTGRQGMAPKTLRGGWSLDSTPGVLLSHGTTWSTMRKASISILRNLGMGKQAFEDMIRDEVHKFVIFLEKHQNQALNIDMLFHRSFITIIWRIISGESLPIGHSTLDELLKIDQTILKEAGYNLIMGSLHNDIKISLVCKLFKYQIVHQHSMFLSIMRNTIEEQKLKGIHDQYHSFTEALLAKMTDPKEELKPLKGQLGHLNIMNTLVDLVMAGSDTTGCALQWAFTYMILNPEIQRKVQLDIEHGTDAYTDAVIHEIHRKSKVVASSVFHAATEDIYYKEYVIPKGSYIIPLLGNVMNNPADFPNPEKFDPERYLSYQDGQLKFTPHPKVIPFSLGKRRCLGEAIGRVAMKTYLTEVLKHFDLTTNDIIDDEAKPGYIRGPKHYNIIFKARF